MDTVTVALVIRMTGLLLLTPADANGGGPTYVLLPETHHLEEPHVAQIGYRAPECESANPDGVCWLTLDDWSVDFGVPTSAAPVALSHQDANLSGITGLRIPRELLGPEPDTSVLKSRILLGSGAESASCPLAQWAIGGGASRVQMANVIEWTITDLPADGAVLRRTPLRVLGGEETVRLSPGEGNTIEVYIRHIPEAEARYQDGEAASYRVPVLALGDSAKHFHAVYDLLNAPPDQRPLPRYHGFILGSCQHLWPIGRRDRMPGQLQMAMGRDDDWSPTTVSCMIGTGLPN